MGAAFCMHQLPLPINLSYVSQAETLRDEVIGDFIIKIWISLGLNNGNMWVNLSTQLNKIDYNYKYVRA